MKTMKKISALITLSVFAVSFGVFSQNNKAAGDKNKMHIKIEVEKDGKTTKIDTTLNPDDLAAFNESMKEQGIYVGTLENNPDVSSYAFATDDKQLQKEMKKLEQQMKDGKFNTDEYEKQMELMEENMSDSNGMFKYKIKTDGDSSREIEIEKELGNMNFNFSDDGGTKTITIDGDDVKIDGDKGGKEIIIKKEAKPGSKKNSKQKKETKKVIIIMKSSSIAPEKQKAEFASEPVKDENKNEAENAKRIWVAKKDNSWLNELSCYPNPSTGEFTLSFRLSNPEPAELKVMDVAGREVFAENIPANSEWVEKQIKLPANSSAAYLLILRQGNNWHHEKIFVRS
jgi:hypothetical protein